MLMRDGVIEKMFIEPQKPSDPCEVSDAETSSCRKSSRRIGRTTGRD
jgi:hypothetical protein